MGRTNQTQWSGPARASDNQNTVTVDQVATSQAVALIAKRLPFPVAIQSLQDFKFLCVGEFDWGKEERHGRGSCLDLCVQDNRTCG